MKSQFAKFSHEAYKTTTKVGSYRKKPINKQLMNAKDNMFFFLCSKFHEMKQNFYKLKARG